MIAGAVLAAAATVGPPVAVRKRDPSRVVEGWIGGPQVTIVEIEGDRWAKVVADTRDCLVPELPAAALQDGAAEGLPSGYGKAQSKQDRIARLKEIVKKTKDYEAQDMPYSAETEIKKAIPEFE